MIETTLNMHIETLKKIDRAAHSLHVARSHLIRILLKRLMYEDLKPKIFTSSIKYQKSDSKSNWKTIHLTIKIDEYEYCLDLRKIFKMSLSFLIAQAAEKLLNDGAYESGKKIISKNNNYIYHNYVFCTKVINGVKCFSHYWGLPDIQLIMMT